MATRNQQRLRQRLEQQEEQRRQQAEQARATAEAKQRQKDAIELVTHVRMADRRLSALGVTDDSVFRRAENVLTSAFRQAKAEGRPFDRRRVLDTFLAKQGLIALPPTPKEGNTIEAHLPPPRGEGRVNPMASDPIQEAELTERRRLADAHGEKLRQRRDAERHAQDDYFRKHPGIYNPALGMPASIGKLGG